MSSYTCTHAQIDSSLASTSISLDRSALNTSTLNNSTATASESAILRFGETFDGLFLTGVLDSSEGMRRRLGTQIVSEGANAKSVELWQSLLILTSRAVDSGDVVTAKTRKDLVKLHRRATTLIGKEVRSQR